MNSSRLLALSCHANCPKCGLPTDFHIFESGPGGDFDTYLGERTGSIYRVDLGKVHYQGAGLSGLLAPALEREECLIKVPEELPCSLCHCVLGRVSVLVDGEETIEGYQL